MSSAVWPSPRQLNLGAPLPLMREKLRAGRADHGRRAWLVVDDRLRHIRAGISGGHEGRAFAAASFARIGVVNSGHVFETVGGNLARLEKDVLRYRPDLVVWQVGTNDVLWRSGASRRRRRVARRRAAAQAERRRSHSDGPARRAGRAPEGILCRNGKSDRGCRPRGGRRSFPAFSVDAARARRRGLPAWWHGTACTIRQPAIAASALRWRA